MLDRPGAHRLVDRWNAIVTSWCCNQVYLPCPCYLPTAVFVEDIDKLFDSFNSVKHAAPGKTLCSPVSDNSPHIGHWTKASIGIKSWIFLKNGKLPSRN